MFRLKDFALMKITPTALLVRAMLCLLPFVPQLAISDQQYFLNLFPEPSVNRGYIILDYAYFDESLDVFNYSSRLGGASKPDRASAKFIGLGLKLTDNIWISYEDEDSEGTVVRSAEPLSIETNLAGESLHLRWSIGKWFGFKTQLFIGMADRKQGDLDIECYEYSGVILGGDCDNADFRLFDGDLFSQTGEKVYYPVLSTKADEDRWFAGAVAELQLSSRLTLKQALKYQQAEISVTTTSPLFEIQSDFLLNANFGGRRLGDVLDELRNTLPQDTPWKEKSLRYDIGATYTFTDSLLAAASIGYVHVVRNQYQTSPGLKDYNRNFVVNASLWFAPTRFLATYIRGELTSNYLLGLDPITYNRKTSRFFEHPYGQLSAGIIISF
jgi:hypothetical protein